MTPIAGKAYSSTSPNSQPRPTISFLKRLKSWPNLALQMLNGGRSQMRCQHQIQIGIDFFKDAAWSLSADVLDRLGRESLNAFAARESGFAKRLAI